MVHAAVFRAWPWAWMEGALEGISHVDPVVYWGGTGFMLSTRLLHETLSKLGAS